MPPDNSLPGAGPALPSQAPGLSVDDLASAIKGKYPSYQAVDNHQLVSAVIAKHPVYQTHLSSDALGKLANPPQGSPEPTGAWAATKELGKGLYDFGKDVLYPGTPLVEGPNSLWQKYMVQPVTQQSQEAQAARAAGRPLEAAGHDLAGMIPFVGPIAAEAGAKLGRKDYAGGAVTSAMALLGAKGMAGEGTIADNVAKGTEAYKSAIAPQPTPIEAAAKIAPRPEAPDAVATHPAAPSPMPVTSARHAEAVATATRLGPEFQEAEFGHEINRLEKVVREAPPEEKQIASTQLADTREQLAEFRSQSKGPGQPPTTSKVDLESTLYQRIKEPGNPLRNDALKANVQKLMDPEQRTAALSTADQMDQKAFRANEQAKVIRQVLDKQDDVNLVKSKLGAWSTQAMAQYDEDTGLPVKGTSKLEFQNEATQAERDVYNKLLGRKLEEARAFEPATNRVVKPPKVNSPEEQAQVDEFISKLTNERDQVVQQIHAGMPVTEEALQHAADLHDQITQLTGMRQRAIPGFDKSKDVARPTAGKAKPIVDAQGVVRPDPSSPLPELTQELYNGFMGRTGGKEGGSTRLAIKPELLERRIGQLNEEARLRSTISSTLRSAHGDTTVVDRTPLSPVEQKEVQAPTPRPAAEVAASQREVVVKALAEGPETKPGVNLPPKPPDEPGYFWGKVLDAQGNQVDWKKFPASGPGTMGAHQGFDPTGSTLDALTDTIRSRVPPEIPLMAKVRQWVGLGDAVGTGANAVLDVSNKVRAGIAGVRDMVRGPQAWTDLKDATGKWSGALQTLQKSVLDFQKVIKKSHPEKLARVGITNYIQAGGDLERLEFQRDNSKGALAKGYDRALHLTDEEKLTAYHIRSTMDDMWDVAAKEGILKSFVENYVQQVWKKGDATIGGQRTLNALGHSLRPDPNFARQRFYDSYFDGEQKGKIPLDKDIGFLTSNYYREMTRAIAARAYVRSLHDGVMSDGRPIVDNAGTGHILPANEIGDHAYAINSSTKPADLADYRKIDVPALRDYVYASRDENGQPIFVKGDALAHPDAYKFLKNTFATSPIRNSALGRAALATSGAAKNLMMAFSFMHQGQLDLHSLFHGINPGNLAELDLEHPQTRELLDHGLQLFDPSGHMDWSEGNTGSGRLATKIPGIGPLYQRYNDWLWNKHLPELKQAMAQKAFESNLQRYGSAYSRDQIAEMTANQANAAFGGINHMMLGRSAGVQDAMRLMLLAPDFLEARAKFVGQAMKPGGREQAIALLRGAAGLYVSARIANAAANNGNMHTDTPFGLVLNNREYQIRSIPGDIVKLTDDWRGFAMSRMNPITARTPMEALSGRDDLGRKVTLGEQLADLAKAPLPFSAQKGFTANSGHKLLDSALQVFGVSASQYHTPAVKSLRTAIFARETPGDRQTGNKPLQDLRRVAADGDWDQFDHHVDDYLDKGLVTKEQVDGIMKDAEQPEIYGLAKRATVPELAEAWKHANEEEKDIIAEAVDKKAKALMASGKVPDATKAQIDDLMSKGFK